MRALQLAGIRQLQMADVPLPPDPGPEDVLVRVKAVGICGTDLHYYRGESAGYENVGYPFVMGHEFAGLVEKVGANVTEVKPGDRVAVDPAISCGKCEHCLEGHPHVCYHGRFVGTPSQYGVGAMQDLLVHPARLVFKLPDNVSFVQGAVLEPLGVALHAIDLGKLRVADTVAVLGCGPIGQFVVRLARLSGAQEVFATDVLDYRLDAARACGASMIINPTRQDPVAAILEATRGRGVDVSFEVAGALETPEQAAEVTTGCGTVVVVGICSADQIALRATPSRRKGLTIKVSRRMKHIYTRTIALSARRMVDIDSVVTHTFPLERGADAFRLLDAYADNVGKVVITLP